jgi:hypothetical protein
MDARQWVAAGLGVASMLVALALHVEHDGQPGVATLYGAELDESADVPVARGEAAFATRGNLALYLPTEVAVRSGRFDLVVHFHGGSKLQEQNIDEAKLRAAVVSVNEGAGSASYGKPWSASGSLDRLIRFAEEEMGKRRLVNARVGRVALSSWSAGGAAVRGILDRDGERVDAVIVADGLFSTYEDEKKTSVRREPLAPFIAFGQRAARGEKTFVVTHTAIAPTQYPNVAECTAKLLSELDVGSPAGTTYVVERGGLKVEGSDGTGPEDHVAQIKSLDRAYAFLAKRWGD